LTNIVHEAREVGIAVRDRVEETIRVPAGELRDVEVVAFGQPDIGVGHLHIAFLCRKHIRPFKGATFALNTGDQGMGSGSEGNRHRTRRGQRNASVAVDGRYRAGTRAAGDGEALPAHGPSDVVEDADRGSEALQVCGETGPGASIGSCGGDGVRDLGRPERGVPDAAVLEADAEPDRGSRARRRDHVSGGNHVVRNDNGRRLGREQRVHHREAAFEGEQRGRRKAGKRRQFKENPRGGGIPGDSVGSSRKDANGASCEC
jgi:hypothetical protein